MLTSTKSYDLFYKNCNNFTNDFANFLVGRGIPSHITSLPETVLNTPFGQMLKPQLDQAIRGVTQAPVPPTSTKAAGVTNGVPSSQKLAANRTSQTQGIVQEVTELSRLNNLLERARSSCAAIFFTSSTCAPCKICYPAYDSLASEFEGKATLIKVDINSAREIAAQFQVRATPTFMTFLHGTKLEEWSGADPAKLLGNIRLLVQMAHPPHPHSQLNLPLLQRRHKPIIYSKIPPIEKLLAKLEPSQSSNLSVQSLKSFIEARNNSTTAALATVPDLQAISTFVQSCLVSSNVSLPPFPLVDLLRLSFLDPRVSGFFAEEATSSSLVLQVLRLASSLSEGDLMSVSTQATPYPFLLTAAQALANLFISPLASRTLLGNLEYRAPLIELISNLLAATAGQKTAQESSLRAAAASLAFNVASVVHSRRFDQSSSSTPTEILDEGGQVELLAPLLEAFNKEGKRDPKELNQDTARVLLYSVGLLAYECLQEGEVRDLLQAMGTEETVKRFTGADSCKAIVEEVKQLVN